MPPVRNDIGACRLALTESLPNCRAWRPPNG